MNKKFVPAGNAALLSQHAASGLRIASDLMQMMSADLPQPTKDAMSSVLQTGGRVAIELGVDRTGKTFVSLVAIELEGSRRVLAEVATVGAGSDTVN